MKFTPDNFQHFRVGCVDFQAYHIRAGYHDLLYCCFPEFKNTVDDFAFFLFQGTVFFSHIG